MPFRRELSTNLIGTGLTFGLGMANQALLARGLGDEGRGQLGLIVTSIAFGALLLGEWLNRGNTFAAGRESDRGRQILANTLVYGAWVGALLVAVAAVGQRLWSPLAFGLTPDVYYVVAGIAAATVTYKAGQAIVLGEDRLHLYAFLPVVLIAVWLAGNWFALRVWSAGVGGVLTAWLVAAVVALGATVIPIWKGLGRFDAALFSRTSAVGGRGAASCILIFLLFRGNVFLVQYFHGMAQLGVYMIAVVIAEMMQRLPNIAGTVLLPKVIRGGDEGHRLSLQVARKVLLFSLLAAAVAVAAGRPAIELLFTSEFSGAYEPLLWMLPGLVASGFGSVLNTRLAGQGYPPVTIWAPAVAAGLGASLSAWSIPAMGLKGAALGTSAAYILWVAIIAQHYRAESMGSWRDFLLTRKTGDTIGVQR